VIELLAREADSEANVDGQVRRDHVSNHNMPRCEGLLFRLDRLGLLARSVSSRGGRLASCIPLRPPPETPLECSLEGELRLSPIAHARVDGKVDPSRGSAMAHGKEAIMAVLSLMKQCGLLDNAGQKKGLVSPRFVLSRTHPKRLCTNLAR
jgi:hypothetical protein